MLDKAVIQVLAAGNEEKRLRTFLRRMRTHPSIFVSLLVSVLALVQLLPPPYSLIGNLVVAALSVIAIILSVREAQGDERETAARIGAVYDETPRGRVERNVMQMRDSMHPRGTKNEEEV